MRMRLERRFGEGGPRCAPRFGPEGVRGLRRGPGRGGFGGPDGPGPGGRRRGLFGGDELRLVLLALLAEQPRHGYDLIREIEAKTGGAYAPSPGIVYPTLTMLQDMGLIAEAAADGARKAYAATAEGTAHLDANRAAVDALLARIGELGTSQRRTDRSPVRRAVHNLHRALNERVTRDEDDAELMHRLAALLDEVTQKIERS